MAAAAVLRPSSHSSSARHNSLLGQFRPRSAGRSGQLEAASAATSSQRRQSEKRTPAASRRSFPEVNARSTSRSTQSGFSRDRTSGNAAAAAATLPASTGSATSGLARRAPSSTVQALLGHTQPSAGRTTGVGTRASDSSTRPPQPQDRRKSAASIRAGMMVATSSKSLGTASNNSSSPRSSNLGNASDVAQDTAEVSNLGRPSVAVTTQKIQVPAGVEEDFESYNWLSDAAIAFASSCLASSGSPSLAAERHAFPKSISFMDPAMVFWLIMQDESSYLDEAKKEMKLPELELLLCPINDAHSACHADAGCHWSLLVCWGDGRCGSRRSRTAGEPHGPLSNFRYYDSLGGLFAERGIAQAKQLATRLAGRPVEVEMGECAQQTNFYDCGVYVLLFSEMIAKAFVESRKRATLGRTVSPLEWEERLLAIMPEEVVACRAHFHDLAREGYSQ